MENIIKLIYSNYDYYTNSQKTIADYIINNFNNITYDTLNTLAQKIGVSTTSIIRFAKELDFNGYSELQESIRAYADSDDPFNVAKNFREIENESISELFHNSLNKDIDNLKRTINSLSKDDLEKSIEYLANARRVYVIGYNDSFTMAYYMSARLGQVRESVYLLQAVGGLYPMEVASSNEEDLLVAFLFPRYSMYTINIINRVRKNGGKVLIVTSNNIGKIKGFGDIILPTFVYGSGVRESYIAPMSLCSYLASSVALVNPEESSKFINYTERVLQTGYYLDSN